LATAEKEPVTENGASAHDLTERLKQTRPFESTAQEAMLSLMVAGAAMEREVGKACANFDLSASHYNVLRILGGGPPEGYPRSDIIERMINRGPDVTRLMDRLEEMKLVNRRRSEEDRRVTLHRITDNGRDLLDGMHADMRAVHNRFAQQITADEQQTLTRLCAKVYGVTS
jgi:DNA-binding MarR family transcriptional regulator